MYSILMFFLNVIYFVVKVPGIEPGSSCYINTSSSIELYLLKVCELKTGMFPVTYSCDLCRSRIYIKNYYYY